jgi:acetate kinase
VNAGSSSLKFALFDFVLAPILRQCIDDAKIALLLSMCDAAGTVLDIVAHLGRRVAGANVASTPRISTADRTVSVLVYAADEEPMIARHTHVIIFARIGGCA